MCVWPEPLRPVSSISAEPELSFRLGVKTTAAGTGEGTLPLSFILFFKKASVPFSGVSHPSAGSALEVPRALSAVGCSGV